MERWKREMEGIRNARLVSWLAADHCGEKKRSHVTVPIPDEPELRSTHGVYLLFYLLLLTCILLCRVCYTIPHRVLLQRTMQRSVQV